MTGSVVIATSGISQHQAILLQRLNPTRMRCILTGC